MVDLINYINDSEPLTLEEKVGQCFMPAAFINDSEAEIRSLEKLITEYHIGSICFFHSRASAATNFEGKRTVVHNEKSYDRLLQLIDRYQKAAKYPLLIAIDAEWGLAMRIENTPQYPYALTLGAMENCKDLVFEVGKHIGSDCKKAGIHWNLAPVVDINLNPDNPVIGYRSFGADREKVTEYAKAFVDGMKASGVLNSIKHFPGHGDTAVDSHLGLPKIEKDKTTLFREELYPFIKLIEHGVDSVMVGHLAVPALSGGKSVSASLSKEIITDFLREKLGFEGLVISDALNMHSVSKQFSEKGSIEYRAFNAGNDILCFADEVKLGIKKILDNCSEERIEQSFQRIWKLKKRVFQKHESTLKQDFDFHLLNQKIAQESLALLKGTEEDIKGFRRQGYESVVIGEPKHDLFVSKTGIQAINDKNCLLAVYPPLAKPKNNFGLTKAQLNTAQELLDKKSTVLCLFGNPYVLNLIDWQKAKCVIIAYQDFESFQETAAKHFFGEITSRGKLPITLNA